MTLVMNQDALDVFAQMALDGKRKHFWLIVILCYFAHCLV